MNLTECMPVSVLNAQTTISVRAASFEDALLTQLLSVAQANNDRTFTFHRRADVSVAAAGGDILDRLASCERWACLRPAESSLIMRAEGVFGVISAIGPAHCCQVIVQFWSATQEAGDVAVKHVLTELDTQRVQHVGFRLNWRFLSGRGEVVRARTDEVLQEPLLGESYPKLPDVNEFVRDYLEAPESVLVLQGPPGTGKTRLIRGILAAESTAANEPAEVMYTGDGRILENEEVFVEFISGPFNAFVVEDADHLLTTRSNGNPTLHRFLNIADGIVSAQGKKVIFSTNLPNVRDIDPALVRPGRCFAHIYLEEMQPAEAYKLLERLCEGNSSRSEAAKCTLSQSGKKAISLAEVYSAFRKTASPKKRRSYGVAPAARTRPIGVTSGSQIPF